MSKQAESINTMKLWIMFKDAVSKAVEEVIQSEPEVVAELREHSSPYFDLNSALLWGTLQGAAAAMHKYLGKETNEDNCLAVAQPADQGIQPAGPGRPETASPAPGHARSGRGRKKAGR